jgi:hypothetical protein
MPRAWRDLLLHLVGIVPAAVLVFLLASGFFSAWQGVVVSVAPPPSDDPATLSVRIVDAEGQVTEQPWSAELVRSLDVPFDRVAVPPPTLPEGRPTTTKQRFSLSFSVDRGEGVVTVPTTSPTSLGLGLLALLGLVALRNMVWAGSPVSLQRRGVYLPPSQAAPGVPVQGGAGRTKGRARGKKGPPPPKRRRGR